MPFKRFQKYKSCISEHSEFLSDISKINRRAKTTFIPQFSGLHWHGLEIYNSLFFVLLLKGTVSVNSSGGLLAKMSIPDSQWYL